MALLSLRRRDDDLFFFFFFFFFFLFFSVRDRCEWERDRPTDRCRALPSAFPSSTSAAAASSSSPVLPPALPANPSWVELQRAVFPASAIAFVASTPLLWPLPWPLPWLLQLGGGPPWGVPPWGAPGCRCCCLSVGGGGGGRRWGRWRPAAAAAFCARSALASLSAALKASRFARRLRLPDTRGGCTAKTEVRPARVQQQRRRRG